MTPPSRDEARERLEKDLANDEREYPGLSFVLVFRDDVRALLSPEQGWRDIESAPTDGRSVLVFCPRASDHGYERVRLTWRQDGKWQGANNTSWPPTHWMPLPAPPTKGGE